jgi:hypothetical protein
VALPIPATFTDFRSDTTMKEEKFNSLEQDLIRWCYWTAGYSRPLLARHFECTVAEIQEIVSGGLPREENPVMSAVECKRQPRTPEFQADSLLRPQVETPKVDREWLRKVFQRALGEC